MKKVTALVVVLAMLFAACGGGGGGTALDQAATSPTPANNASGGDAASSGDLEPYELVYFMLTNSVASNELPVVTEAINEITREKFNATVNISMIPWGDWHTVVTTTLGAGEQVDILFTADWYEYMQGIAANYFLPLNDLMQQHAPQVLSQLGNVFVTGSQVNGINYGVPTDKELAVNGGFLWNQNLVDKYGFEPDPNWKSYADWEPYLEIIKQNEPDIVPLLTDGNHYHIDMITYLPLNTGWAVQGSDPTINYRYEMDMYVKELHVMRDLFQKGYIPRDAILDETAWYNQHLSMGNFFLTTQPLKPGKGKSTELMSAAINPDIVYDEFETYPLLVNTTHCGGSMLAIGSTSRDPARAMMFINEMHTNPDMVNLLVWGVEGVTYTVVDTDPTLVLPIDGNQWTSAVLGWTLGNVFLTHLAEYEPRDKYDLLAATKVGIPGHLANGYRFDPTDWLDTIAAVTNSVEEFSRPIRVGAVDTDEGISNLLAAAESAGYRPYLEAVRADFAAWLADQ